MYGINKSGMCFVKNGSPLPDTLELVYTSGFSICTILYCIVISLVVVFKIKTTYPSLNQMTTNSNDPWEKQYSLFSLRSLICRTCLYPAACFLSYLSFNGATIYFFFYKKSHYLMLLGSMFGTGSRGTLHLIAFLSDPIILKTIPTLLKKNDEMGLYHDALQQNALSYDCEISYNSIMAPAASDSSSFHLRRRMIKDFHHYI